MLGNVVVALLERFKPSHHSRSNYKNTINIGSRNAGYELLERDFSRLSVQILPNRSANPGQVLSRPFENQARNRPASEKARRDEPCRAEKAAFLGEPEHVQHPHAPSAFKNVEVFFEFRTPTIDFFQVFRQVRVSPARKSRLFASRPIIDGRWGCVVDCHDEKRRFEGRGPLQINRSAKVDENDRSRISDGGKDSGPDDRNRLGSQGMDQLPKHAERPSRRSADTIRTGCRHRVQTLP